MISLVKKDKNSVKNIMKDHINLGELKKIGKGTINHFIMFEKKTR